MILAHKIALEPTVEQAIGLARAAGTARYTWNWALNEHQNHFKTTGKGINLLDLKKRWNQEKPDWVYESPKDANQQPFAYLKKAFTAFFKKIAKYPKFKKKGEHDAFYVSNDKLKLTTYGVRLPIIGAVKARETLRFVGKVLGAVVSRTAGRWFISVQVDIQDACRQPDSIRRSVVGVDLGLKTAVVTSSSQVFHAPKPLKKSLKHLARRSRAVSRKLKNSNNRKQAIFRLSKLHQKVANIRKDFLHKVTTQLCRENQTVVIEDLNVRGMVKNRKLSRAISDVGFGLFRTLLTYKSVLFGTNLVVADRWFPSSKTCSNCGVVKESLSLAERTFNCGACSASLDRDFNAARNLEQYIPAASGEFTPVEIGVVKPVVETGTKPRADSRRLTN